MKPWQKPSTMLAFAAWLSVFAMAWLLVLRRLPFDWLTGTLFIVSWVLAIAASAIASPDKEGP